MLNISTGGLHYAPGVLEEYRLLFCKTPGFEGSSGSRSKRGYSWVGGLAYYAAFCLSWRQQLEEIHILHFKISSFSSKLKPVRKKLHCQILRELERSDSWVVTSVLGSGIAKSVKKLCEHWHICVRNWAARWAMAYVVSVGLTFVWMYQCPIGSPYLWTRHQWII